MTAFSLRAIHNSYAATSQRVFAHDRSNTVGASEVGQCLRKVWFTKNEIDPDFGITRDPDHEDSWGARVRGSVYENAFWEPALRAGLPEGAELHFAGADQRTLVRDFLSATPDAIVTGLARDCLSHLDVPDIGGDCLVVECKTADPRTKLAEAKPEHVFQVQVQIGLIRATTNFRPEWGLITYTDTSFWNEVIEFPVCFDEAVYLHALDRAALAMTASNVHDVRPEGWIAGGKECDFCPFTGACGRAKAERVPAENRCADPEVEAEIATKGRLARLLKTEAEAILTRAKAKEQEVRDLMASAGARSVDRDGVKITWSAVRGRPSYDMKGLRAAAEAAGIDVEAFSTVGDPTDRLVITVRD